MKVLDGKVAVITGGGSGIGAGVARACGAAGMAVAVVDRFGGCHLLLNNAGLCPLGRSWDHSAAEWSHVVGVNLMGVVNGVNAFVPRLLEQGEEAHIVNTASAAALRFVPSSALYNATKFAVVGYTGSQPAVVERHRGIEDAYRDQRARHADLP